MIRTRVRGGNTHRKIDFKYDKWSSDVYFFRCISHGCTPKLRYRNAEFWKSFGISMTVCPLSYAKCFRLCLSIFYVNYVSRQSVILKNLHVRVFTRPRVIIVFINPIKISFSNKSAYNMTESCKYPKCDLHIFADIDFFVRQILWLYIIESCFSERK